MTQVTGLFHTEVVPTLIIELHAFSIHTTEGNLPQVCRTICVCGLAFFAIGGDVVHNTH